MTATMPTSPPTAGPPPAPPRPPSRLAGKLAGLRRWHPRWWLWPSLIAAAAVGWFLVSFASSLGKTPTVTVNTPAASAPAPSAPPTTAMADGWFDYLAIGDPSGVFTYDLSQVAKMLIPLDPAFPTTDPPHWDRAIARDIAGQVRRMRGDQCRFGLTVSDTEVVVNAAGHNKWRRIVTPEASIDAPRLLDCAGRGATQIPTVPSTPTPTSTPGGS